MYTQKIRKIGNSDGVIIPKPFLDALGLTPGEEVELKIIDGQLALKPVVKGKYLLEDLVAQMSDGNEHPEVSWGSLVGKEVVEYEEKSVSRDPQQKRGKNQSAC